MSDIVFRQKSEQVSQPEVLPAGKETTRGDESKEEVPYLDYEREHNHPYSVDYFQLGDTWQDPRGGFPKEISVIEEYFQNMINRGELANSVKTVKGELEKLEKINNLDGEERAVVKIGVLTAYVKFLMKTDKTDKIKFNLARYGGKHGHY